MRYRAILLDADDTLFDFAAAEKAAFSNFLNEINFHQPDALQEYIRINDACWLDLERGRISQGELRIRRFREFLDHYEHPLSPERAAEMYEMMLGEQAVLLPGALEVVREIASDRPVAIVTNGIGRVQRARLKKSPINAYIKALVISEDVGVAKPDPRMIYAALDALGMPGEKAVLMAGDSLKSDMGAAINAGIDGCWLNPLKAERPRGLPIAHEIASIDELPAIALMDE